MKKILLTTMAGCMLMAAAPSMAQTALRSSYFSENFMQRHELNPAFTPERSYFSILPVLGGINVGMHSNLSIADILYPQSNGKLATFMNSNVSADFLKRLNTNNCIGTDINLNIVSVGFKAFKGYNTISLGVRTNVYANLPKGLFEFMKLGQTGESSTYCFDKLGVKADAYAELALGHQHKINDHWSVGGKLKLLLGVAHADMSVDNMTMTTGSDKWMLNANGKMNLAIKGLYLPTNAEVGNYKRPLFDNSYNFKEADFDSPGLSGFGLGFDLGVNYKAHFLEGLELSAALLDLGFISYSNNIYGAMDNNAPWEFDGFTICTDENKPGHNGHETFDDQLDRLGAEMGDYLNFKKGNKNKVTTGLAATLNIGASYAMPFYKGLKVGFLSSTRINGAYSWSEGRFIANVNPVKGLDININYGISSWGNSFGWLINYATTGFGIYLGMDHTLGDVAKPFVPMSGNASLAFGVTFPLGHNKSKN